MSKTETFQRLIKILIYWLNKKFIAVVHFNFLFYENAFLNGYLKAALCKQLYKILKQSKETSESKKHQKRRKII